MVALHIGYMLSAKFESCKQSPVSRL